MVIIIISILNEMTSIKAANAPFWQKYTYLFFRIWHLNLMRVCVCVFIRLLWLFLVHVLTSQSTVGFAITTQKFPTWRPIVGYVHPANNTMDSTKMETIIGRSMNNWIAVASRRNVSMLVNPHRRHFRQNLHRMDFVMSVMRLSA